MNSSTLLCTTGSSPAVVMGAYLLCEPRPASVHCITTESESTPVGMLREFFAEVGAPFTCTRVAGIADLKSGDDQKVFDEVMYRWFLHHRTGHGRLLVCVAGGFKTMSASLQQAAEHFGAEEVFHILAGNVERQGGWPSPPCDEAEVRAGIAGGQVNRIDLAPSSGWTPLRRLLPEHYRLDITAVADGEFVAAASGAALREVVAAETQRAFHSTEPTEAPPIPSISLLAAHERSWLAEPLDSEGDRDWLRALPKIELHCHLGGFATHGGLLDDVRTAAESPSHVPELKNLEFPDGWPVPGSTIDLNAYMRLGDNSGSALLKDAGCLRRQCQLLYQQLVADGVVYAEIRCSPNNYARIGRSAWDVLADIQTTFDECIARFEGSCHVNLIVIATRKASGDLSDISRHLALAITAAGTATPLGTPDGGQARCEVVGVDLAGYENVSTRPTYFASDFRGVHRCGLNTTLHAGENDDVEAIWQAVFDLHADRLGHALRLADSPDLLRVVARRSIAVELCPYANLQIVGFAPFNGDSEYPLRAYLDRRVRVTVNTDNIGISSASLVDNLALAARLCPRDAPLTRREILLLQRNALEAAFIQPSERAVLLAKMSNWFAQFPR